MAGAPADGPSPASTWHPPGLCSPDSPRVFRCFYLDFLYEWRDCCFGLYGGEGKPQAIGNIEVFRYNVDMVEECEDAMWILLAR